MKDKDGREHDDKGQFAKANEFRYDVSSSNYKMRHPNHIYAKNDTHAKHMTITHSPRIKGSHLDNIPMHKNPNPNDKASSYFVPKSKISKLDIFGKPVKRWKLSEQDDKEMDKYRDK